MEKVRCKVLKVIFTDRESGYTVFSAVPEGSKAPIKVVGQYYAVSEGVTLDVEGDWGVDAKYGRQFVAQLWTEILPETVTGIEKYLASGIVKGIGPKVAQIIVQRFGLDTFDVIENFPERLCTIPGIGSKRAKSISDNVRKQNVVKDIMVFLQSYGITTGLAIKIYRQYGVLAIAKMKADPYQIAEDIDGIGFLTADKIGKAMGYADDDPRRLKSGIIYTLNECVGEGDVCREREQLINKASLLLEGGSELIEECLEDLLRQHKVIEDVGSIYLPMYYHSEVGVARRLASIMDYDVNTYRDLEVMQRAIQATGVKYDDRQLEAIRMAVTSKVLVLTGGPGTGKTTTVKGIISVMEENYNSKNILLCAPTGRAAKRMSEATGRESKTIHRLLEFNPQEGGFTRNEDNPLKGNVIIVDESSMIDLLLMYSLLKAVPDHMRVILVGDIDQLPSVGAGNVLHDIIDSGSIPVIRLQRIFRQAQESFIVTNAHRINSGVSPEITNKKGTDFFFQKMDNDDDVAATVVSLVSGRVTKAFGYSVDDIQVLAPMRRRSAVGCDNLNAVIQEKVNPHGKGIALGDCKLRRRERVMQMRNNYKKGVFNGDIGTILSVDEENEAISVSFIGINQPVIYEGDDLDELVLAYATTIHKSQGSEYPVVIIPLTMSSYVMLQRNLLYTAITRAKKLCIIVGSRQAMDMAVSREGILTRQTWLAERLSTFCGENGRSYKSGLL